MAQTGSSITAHAALVAVVAVAVLCLTGAKPSAACKLGKSNCLPPIVPRAAPPAVEKADGNGK
jgi:hypothetical protein|uniref:Uncharacterized protein n=1 Tax=Oryza rufipogon TaxID=4529 RepID=A0A0E0QI37_ORYRU